MQLFFIGLGLFMIEQYVVPLLINSVEPLEKMIWPRIIERVLKLSVRIPSVFLSLSLFISFLHYLFAGTGRCL
jgi:hypothetical protein